MQVTQITCSRDTHKIELPKLAIESSHDYTRLIQTVLSHAYDLNMKRTWYVFKKWN